MVTIPESASPDLDLKMNMGSLMADEGITFSDVKLDADMGSIELKNCQAKELNLDAIHDIVHEIARDEARHGKAFKGLLDRYFS